MRPYHVPGYPIEEVKPAKPRWLKRIGQGGGEQLAVIFSALLCVIVIPWGIIDIVHTDNQVDACIEVAFNNPTIETGDQVAASCNKGFGFELVHIHTVRNHVAMKLDHTLGPDMLKRLAKMHAELADR